MGPRFLEIELTSGSTLNKNVYINSANKYINIV